MNTRQIIWLSALAGEFVVDADPRVIKGTIGKTEKRGALQQQSGEPVTWDAQQHTLNLLRQETARDKQSKVGASNFSSLCTRCLGDDLLGLKPHGQSQHYLGAVVGTAIHAMLEERGQNDPDTLTEFKLTLGELPGYGVIKSTMDLYHEPSGTVGDYKTTTKDKLVFIKRALLDEPDEFEVSKVTDARFKVAGYINQALSYGRGMVLAGYDVKNVVLIFVCRDGSGDKDVWSYMIPYDQEQADKVWLRLERLWAWLQEGNDPRKLPSHASCYYCSNVRDWTDDYKEDFNVND